MPSTSRPSTRMRCSTIELADRPCRSSTGGWPSSRGRSWSSDACASASATCSSWPALNPTIDGRRSPATWSSSAGGWAWSNGSVSARYRRPCRIPGTCRSSGRRPRRAGCGAISSRVRPDYCGCRRPRSASWRWRWPTAVSRRSAISRRSPTTCPGHILRRRSRWWRRSVATSGSCCRPGDLADESRQLRTRLDTATALEETTRTYVERLESMVDEQRLPSGDDLIGEIERFLREGGTEGRPQS